MIYYTDTVAYAKKKYRLSILQVLEEIDKLENKPSPQGET